MSSFNSIRWSPNTDLSKTNMQQIFDNDKKLYDDLTKYNSGFSFSEIEVTTQYSLTASKSNLLDATTRKLFYETTGSNVSLKLPGTNQVSSGTSWVMFGCRVTFKDNGTTDLIRKRPIGIFLLLRMRIMRIVLLSNYMQCLIIMLRLVTLICIVYVLVK